MGMRKYQRDIARARMSAMGVRISNLGNDIMPSKSKVRRLQKTARGRRTLERLRAMKAPRWKRVTTGDLAKEALGAQMLLGSRIKKMKLAKKARLKRKIRPIEAPAR